MYRAPAGQPTLAETCGQILPSKSYPGKCHCLTLFSCLTWSRTRREPRKDPGGPAPRVGGEDLASRECEHARAHWRTRRELLEIQSLLDAIKSEMEAEEVPGPQHPAPRAEAEDLVARLCAEAERKAAEAARMGRRIAELHQRIAGCECC
ncbi:MORF4 family associated protein 1 like 2-like [Pongo pygmaeus]|uniref:MORF4 family associated protein 1 like 2-like n=1 Tax=Pongo pygmaeus TaxID=9600 RepID=UPI0023E33BF3|nr:putative MORF4 family-associated protein 1-like protein UPP [Pongo pygmaeus]